MTDSLGQSTRKVNKTATHFRHSFKPIHYISIYLTLIELQLMQYREYIGPQTNCVNLYLDRATLSPLLEWSGVTRRV